jgi:SAM-dependent methyltransferase
MSAAGHAVLAIDPEAPEGKIFRRSTVEGLDETGAFDAVVASRSLHHVTDLAVALDKIAGLLASGGMVVVDDFGWERLDKHAADRTGISLAEWQAEHDHLHSSQAMLKELDSRFTRRSFSWGPYLHREGGLVLTERAERELIEANELPAIGFRYVGRR